MGGSSLLLSFGLEGEYGVDWLHFDSFYLFIGGLSRGVAGVVF
jgi:hypothetical protein